MARHSNKLDILIGIILKGFEVINVNDLSAIRHPSMADRTIWIVMTLCHQVVVSEVDMREGACMKQYLDLGSCCLGVGSEMRSN